MAATELSLSDLMIRLRYGDQKAAAQVVQRYANELIALARSRLDHLLRRKVDPEDILQSALQSFFAGSREGQFEVRDWGSLWGLLTTITLRKCGHQSEYFRAARRDLRREVAPGEQADESLPAPDIAGPAPTPEEAAVLAETLEELLQQLDDRSRDIVSLRLQGYTTCEISTREGCTERTVQRVLERVRKWLEQREADAPEGR